MKKFMTEQEVLKRLGTKGFRHASKFASILPNVSPEVAMKILDQFPSFAEAMIDMASQYKETLLKALDSGSLSTNHSLIICQSILDGLRDQLDKGYIEQMQYVAQCAKEITSEHHSFVLKLAGYGCLGFIFGGVSLWCAMGGNFDFILPNK